MNGVWGSSLLVAIGWLAVNGDLVDSTKIPDKSFPMPKTTSAIQAKRSANLNDAVQLDRPIPVSLDKPRPLASSVVAQSRPVPPKKGPFARTPQWFSNSSSTLFNAIFRGQSPDEAPIAVSNITRGQENPKTGGEATQVTQGNSWTAEIISDVFPSDRQKPKKTHRKAAVDGTFAEEMVETSIGETREPNVEAKPKEKTLFAGDRTGEIILARGEAPESDDDDVVLFASDRESEPSSAKAALPQGLVKADKDSKSESTPTEPSKDRPVKENSKSLAQKPVDEEVEPSAEEPKKNEEPKSIEEPKKLDKEIKGDEPKTATEKIMPSAEEKKPEKIPGPLDQTQIKLDEPRLTPSSAEVEFIEPNRFYVGAEYLLWFTKGEHIPPLVTTSPAASGGILNQPGTVILFGNQSIHDEWHSGGRFTLGYWCDDCQQSGVEVSYFFLEQRTTRFFAGSDAFPLLARPIFEQNNGQEFSQISTRPDLASGGIAVDAPSRLWGAEINWKEKYCCGCDYSLYCLAGFRYLELDEGLHVTEDLVVQPAVPQFGGDHIIVSDRFDTRNQFYGGQLGLEGEYRYGSWFVDGRVKVALGDNHESLTIGGNQVITTPTGATSVFTGGLLALPSNIGHFTRDRFAVVPELGLKLGYQFNQALRFTVGYDFVYWSRVIRPGDQIDRVIDVNQIPNFGVNAPGVANSRPAVLFKETDFWAQGISFGVEWRY